MAGLDDKISESMEYSVRTLPVDQKGIVHAETLRSTLSENTRLVSIMLANSEIGVIESIAEIAQIVHEVGILFYADTVQAIVHIPVDVKKLDADMLSASKWYIMFTFCLSCMLQGYHLLSF